MGSGSDESIYWTFTNRNYTQLSQFQDCGNYNTQIIITLSRYKVFNCWTALNDVLRLTDESVTNLWRISLSEWVSYITTDGQSASLSWCQAPISGLRPDFYYCQTIAGLLMWGALSDERTGLSFTMYNVQYIYILHVILRYSVTNPI
jgi:hypothetical protein